METIFSLIPIINDKSKILILGTIPGKESLRLNQYYANEKNQFWTIMSKLFDVDVSGEYSDSIEILLKNNVAIWDVLESCVRSGSLDRDILEPRINNFEQLLLEYTNIEFILFNGVTASKLFGNRLKRSLVNIKNFITLPSTSPTPGRYVLKLEEKIEKWAIIKQLYK